MEEPTRNSGSPKMHCPLKRYLSIGITEALHQLHQFHLASTDLSFILKHAYSKLPKNVQTLIFRDTLSAFRLLPQMQAQNAISAANLLHRSADAVLPKHKRVLALSEFKQAKIAYKRLCKYQLEGEAITELPQDVLMHIFSFLDVQVLLSVALVCRSWNLAANEGYLWQSQYLSFFGNYDKSSIARSSDCDIINWKEAFKSKYAGSISKKFTYRGYCQCCKILVFLKNMECPYKDPEQNSHRHQIVPMLPHQIAEFVLNIDPLNVDSCYDSESEDEMCMLKLWAYPEWQE